jgi:hypothetical protein
LKEIKDENKRNIAICGNGIRGRLEGMKKGKAGSLGGSRDREMRQIGRGRTGE